MNSETLTNRVRAGYGIGDYAICLYWSGIGLYLLYFYTDVVGISPILAGWIYALGIGWDLMSLRHFFGVESRVVAVCPHVR